MLVPSLHKESTKSLTTSSSTLNSGAVTLDADLIERNLPIVISAIDCNGSENNITSCTYTTAEDENNCDNAYVVCQSMSLQQVIMTSTVSSLYAY